MENKISWAARRLGFHCRCARCLASVGSISQKLGKFWQAGYGESAQAFKRRYKDFHATPKTRVIRLKDGESVPAIGAKRCDVCGQHLCVCAECSNA